MDYALCSRETLDGSLARFFDLYGAKIPPFLGGPGGVPGPKNPKKRGFWGVPGGGRFLTGNRGGGKFAWDEFKLCY